MPTASGVYVLVSSGVLQNGGHVDAAFVRKSALADEGLVVGQRQVGQFGDVPAHRSEAGQLLGTHGGVAQLQLQVGEDGRQVGVAAPLAVAVHAALHVRGAGFHGGDRVGHGQVGIVMRMDADHAVEALAHFRHGVHQPEGDGAAVGVAEAQHRGAGGLRGFERAQGVLGIGGVAVEEMLGVVDHFLAVVDEELHGLGNELQVLVERDAQRAGHVQVPSLAENRHGRCTGLDQRPHVAVFLHGVAGEARGTERDEARVLEFEARGRGEELAILGVGAGPSTLDVVDAELVELLGNERFCPPPRKRRIHPACRPGAWYRTSRFS